MYAPLEFSCIKILQKIFKLLVMRKNLFFYRRNMLALITILVMFSSGNMLGQGFISTIPITTANVTVTTGDKPQSKVWTYDGKWWMVMPNSTGTHIFRLDGDVWTSILTIDASKFARADCKVVGNVTHILLYKAVTSSLVSVEYNSGTYQLWISRPTTAVVTLDTGVETATIDVDSNGRMWVASDAATDINVRWSDFPYSTWSAPINIESGVSTDDICVITAFGGKIGVLWSNEISKRFGFKYHTDGEDPEIWSTNEVPASQSADNIGGGMADDHLNLAVASDGTIFAAVKTSYDLTGFPKIALLIRRPAGTWDNLYPVSNSGTRPIVVLNESLGKVKVIYTANEGNANILYKESSTTNISLSPALTLISGANSSVTSTKQSYTEDIVIMASTSTTLTGVVAKDLVIAAAPVAPTLISPEDVSTETIIAPVLSWNYDATADSHRLQISTVPDFTSTIYDISNITSTSKLVNPPLSKSTTYYWRVNSSNGLGDSDWSSIWSFTTESAGAALVAHWKMDESSGTILNDATIKMNVATTVANPIFATGILGNALQLNGTTQYATVPTSPSMDITAGITLATWIKPTGSSATTQNLIKKAITSGTLINGYELGLTSSRKVYFQINQNTKGKTYRVESSSVYPLNGSEWMHVAGTFDGAVMKLYINGVQEGGNVNGPAGGIASNTLQVGIGAMPTGKYFYKGLLDDVRIYNEALSAPEIFILLQAPPSPPTLISPSHLQKGVDLSVMLQWATSLTADSYRVQVSTVADFTSTVFDQNDLLVNTATLNPPLESSTIYYWRVLATNAQGASQWSSVQSFSTIAPPVAIENNGGGYALDFTSSNNYVDCGNSPSVKITGTAITMEAWIKPSIKSTMAILKKTGSTQGYELYSSSTGVIYSRFNNNAASRAVSSTPYPLNQWIHVAATYDGVNSKMYINGVLEGTTPYQIPIANSINILLIGNDPSDLTKGFKGSIDEVRLWNTVRTDAEIKSNMTKKLVGTESGLVGYWRMDEKSGLAVKDETSNHNDGMMMNMNTTTSHIWSGAALGDKSSQDYDVTNGYSAVLAHANGDNATATTTSGTIKGIQIYQSDNNALRTGSTAPAGYTIDPSRFWGVKVLSASAPAYTMVYNYLGNPLLSNGKTLKLVKRNDISVDAWMDAAATLDTVAHTLTVMGTTGAEYALATAEPEIIIITLTPPNPPTLTSPFNQQKYVEESAVLQWSAAATADYYRVQVSTLADFTSTIFDLNNILVTSATVTPSLESNTVYFWRVLATNSEGSSAWSSVQSFTTTGPPVPLEDSGAGYALSFTSSNNYVDCGNSPSVKITGTAITMEAWIKPTVKGTMSILKKTGSTQGYELFCGSAGFVYSRFNNNTASKAVSSTPYPLNQWIHVAATYDGISTKMYINGVLEGSTSYQAPILNSTNILLIANDPSDLTKGFRGSIDEVRLWNTVRTDAEIKYNMTKKLLGSEVGLVGYWRFDEKSGLMMKDETANHNDGVMTNMNEVSSHIWSCAALGDNSNYDYDVTDGYSAVLAHANGDNATATTTSGTIKGIQIYQSDDNALRTGSTAPTGYTLDSSRFWGVKVINSTAPAYTMVYNYQGNPLVNNGSTLKLVKRNDISVDAWTDASATLDTIGHTLTVMGTTGAEYALATTEVFPIGERKTQNGVQYEESGPELPMENDTLVNPLTDENAILEENVLKDIGSNDSENLQGNTEVTATDDLQSKSDLSINNFLAEEATIINIELKDATSVALYDMQGRRIFYRKLNRNMSGNHIELSNVIPGVYIVQVCSSTVNQSKKIVVR